MTATHTLPAATTNAGRGPFVIPRAIPVLVAALIVLVGARELVGLWQVIADHLARAGADVAVRCLVAVIDRAGEAGPQLSPLAALELAHDVAAVLRTCLLALPLVSSAAGVVVAGGHGVARSLRERAGCPQGAGWVVAA